MHDDFETIQEQAKEIAEIVAETEAVVSEEQLVALAEKQGLAAPTEAPAEVEEPAEQVSELSESERWHLQSSMESVLFMSDKPVSLPKLRSTLRTDVPLQIYRELMSGLRDEYAKEHHGVEIAEVSLGFQFRTKAHMAQILRKMVRTQPLKLSPTTMEVLAIVCYKQPVTKDELDQVRGVDSGYVLRNLMEKRLVRISGRSDLPGRPMVYSTTHEFLELFNLRDLKQLPPLHEIESMVAASEVGVEERDQKAFADFGELVTKNDKVLFEDEISEAEVEALREEIARIPTSTPYLEEEKAKERRAAKLVELRAELADLEAQGRLEEAVVVREEIVELEALDNPQPAAEAAAAPVNEAEPEVEATETAEAEAPAETGGISFEDLENVQLTDISEEVAIVETVASLAQEAARSDLETAAELAPTPPRPEASPDAIEGAEAASDAVWEHAAALLKDRAKDVDA